MVFGFLGKGIFDFFLVLVLMWISFVWLNFDVGGLMVFQFEGEFMSWVKVLDILEYVWILIVVLVIGGVVGLICVMWVNMLDELGKFYVEIVYVQGLSECQVVWGYLVCVVLNLFILMVGWVLLVLFLGDVIIVVVLNILIMGLLLLIVLKMQDMYLVGSFIFIFSVFMIIGILIFDILFVWFDLCICYV